MNMHGIPLFFSLSPFASPLANQFPLIYLGTRLKYSIPICRYHNRIGLNHPPLLSPLRHGFGNFTSLRRRKKKKKTSVVLADTRKESPSTTPQEIKRAYRKLALKFHPDFNKEIERWRVVAASRESSMIFLVMSSLVASFCCSLSQVRCVCKLWCTKINSPHFINSHLTHASEKSTYLYSVKKDPDRVRLRLMGEDDVNCYKLKTICVAPDINMLHRCLIYNSCHSLICYTTAFGVERASDGGLPISVCNPITGESINLPEFTSSQGLVYTPCGSIILKEEDYYEEIPNPLTGGTTLYPKFGSGIKTTAAIGFNPLTKEYKVVVLFHHWVDSVMTWLTLDGGVYSLSGKSWTRISKPPIYAPKVYHTAVWLNGALHWVIDTPHECIMSFDFEG